MIESELEKQIVKQNLRSRLLFCKLNHLTHSKYLTLKNDFYEWHRYFNPHELAKRNREYMSRFPLKIDLNFRLFLT